MDTVQVDEVSDVFRKSGIHRPVDDYHRLFNMIHHANLIATARLSGRLIGIARGFTDYAWCCYLSDLAVDKEFQKMGVGTNLIRNIQTRLGEGVKLILVAAPTAVEYYPRIGFEKVEQAFHVPRKY
ncbi:GNAT family N-acetyltransferase [Alicyclobacillus suci]|uniref:GNAT family N-acetyltransferase n=1 Tax=Alicyclobacillus suci TaxID=2816080 RepID=UPI002E2DFDCB|nr:GNAT family N-acetyltransferase [Alicyclobacillus suci]